MLYLENGVYSGQLAVHGDAKNFRYQMCAQKVGDSLVDVEVTGAHPDFGQKPVIFCIRREKNRVLISWNLVELIHKRKKTHYNLSLQTISIGEPSLRKFQKDPNFIKSDSGIVRGSWSMQRAQVHVSHPSYIIYYL